MTDLEKAITAGLRNSADQISGLSAVVLALVRALEETGNLKRGKFIEVLQKFRSDMSPEDLASEQGQMIQRWLDILDAGEVSQDQKH